MPVLVSANRSDPRVLLKPLGLNPVGLKAREQLGAVLFLKGFIGLYRVLYGLSRLIKVSEKVSGCLPVAR